MTAIPPHHDPACWGCGDNPTGLHLPLPAAEGLTEYEAYFAFDEQHQGGPGIVHGGLVAGALDEAVGLLATWYAFVGTVPRAGSTPWTKVQARRNGSKNRRRSSVATESPVTRCAIWPRST